MISKIVNITFSDRPATYKLQMVGEGSSGEDPSKQREFWSTRSCRLLPPEIAFIEKAERDYNRAQAILAQTYVEWEKNLSTS
tara:strand:- start:266 stop:511 length:246 start_codon:yes stop_codon:yes gene_type:complete